MDGVLPDSFRRELIIILPKNSAASSDLTSGWLVTLSNVDYKLVAYILSRRFREVLSELLHPLQVCSIPGCRISSLTCLTSGILDNRVNSQAIVLLVCLDQCKVLDRVERCYLFDVL